MHPALSDIALVVFDLDGTLIDSAPDLAAAVDRTLAEHDLTAVGVQAVRNWVGNGSYKLVERALAHAYGVAEGEVGPRTVDTAHERFLAHYATAPCEHTLLYDGARQCLERLVARDVTCVLVTNKPSSFLPPILERFDLAPMFALTLGGDSLSEKKPHPMPLRHAAEKTGTRPANALMIGDSRHDVAAGKAAGFRTLAVTYGYNHGEPVADSMPDHVVDSLSELVTDEPAAAGN